MRYLPARQQRTGHLPWVRCVQDSDVCRWIAKNDGYSGIVATTGWLQNLARKSCIRDGKIVLVLKNGNARSKLPSLPIRIGCCRGAAVRRIFDILLHSQGIICRDVQAARVRPDVAMTVARVFKAELLGDRDIRIVLPQHRTRSSSGTLNVQSLLRCAIHEVVRDERQKLAWAQLIANDRGQVAGLRIPGTHAGRVLKSRASASYAGTLTAVW